MLRTLPLIVIIMIWYSCKKRTLPPLPIPLPIQQNDTFIRGADISFLPEIEAFGTLYYNSDSVPSEMLTILKANGCNAIRLRLWYQPATLHSSLSEVVSLANTIKQQKMKVILDFHYSDTWADPGHQAIPSAWSALNLKDLTDSVYSYTKRVMDLIQPEYVQLGNEINGGLLWNQGNITNQTSFTQLLRAGTQACRESKPDSKIIFHYAGLTGSAWFFDMLKSHQLDYDIIGLSYYPLWHGFSLDTLQLTMKNLVDNTAKKIMIIETAYPFTLGWNDYTNNLVGSTSQLIPGYPATPEGQLEFMKKLREIVASNKQGIGFCYWGGEWVAFKGTTSNTGSSWENQALFNFNNRALPVMEVFKK